LIGDDPLNKQYVNYIHSLKSDKVIFLGRIYGDKYEQLSSKAFCYISASEVEGTSPALLSAMGFKTPVLVSDIPENIETIKKYGTTFMTNDESDLIRKIEYVINNPLKVQNLSKKAFKMVKQLYSWEKVADDLHKIYKRL
jgi:glycosyltransferase involved in cell wall biosynthesis